MSSAIVSTCVLKEEPSGCRATTSSAAWASALACWVSPSLWRTKASRTCVNARETLPFGLEHQFEKIPGAIQIAVGLVEAGQVVAAGGD